MPHYRIRRKQIPVGTLPPPLVKMIGAMAVTRQPRGEWAADRTYGSTVILTKVHPAVACSLATS